VSSEGDGSLIFAQAAAGEKLFQAEAQRLAVSIPPVDRKAAHVDAITPHELDRV
jgi:hypothetical protein